MKRKKSEESGDGEDMIDFVDNEKTSESDRPITASPVIFADVANQDEILSALRIENNSRFPASESDAIRFEARDKYYYATLHIPNLNDLTVKPSLVELYITADSLIVFAETADLRRFKDELVTDDPGDGEADRALYALLDHILNRYLNALADIDARMEDLQERSLLKQIEGHNAAIRSLHRELFVLKKYFESLFNLLAELEENHNEIFSKGQLQVFRTLKKKSERLLGIVLGQREYLIQVRETFQNQMDISLNETMRFFTVITAVFLPLTLIAGWYGMNLKMPERTSALAYPIVIVVSVVFIISILIYSKKKDWF